MEAMVRDLDDVIEETGLIQACINATVDKINFLNSIGFNFSIENARMGFPVTGKENILLAQLNRIPYHIEEPIRIFRQLLIANGIRDLKLDENNNIIMPNGSSLRLSVFTKYCQNSCGEPIFDWQAINSINLGEEMFLSIHPADFANCSNKGGGYTSWGSCFSPEGAYCGSPYAYINSPTTLMAVKGTPKKINARMWIHLLKSSYRDNTIIGFCRMKAYGANFTEEEIEIITEAISKAINKPLVVMDYDYLKIVTNNEVNAEQSYIVETTDNDEYTYLDPIKRAWAIEGTTKAYLSIEQPFNKYGNTAHNCEKEVFDDYEEEELSECHHCQNDYRDDEMSYLERYERMVCGNCLDECYFRIDGEWIHTDNAENLYLIRRNNVCIDQIDIENHEYHEYVSDLEEYVHSDCVTYCEVCGEYHADPLIYDYNNVEYPDCWETEEDDERILETLEPAPKSTEQLFQYIFAA